ncbi:MAG: hypothetical protein ACRDTT_19525 [Pseudonocardiaceae bacterium]
MTLDQLGEFVAEHHGRDLFRLATLSFYDAASDDDVVRSATTRTVASPVPRWYMRYAATRAAVVTAELIPPGGAEFAGKFHQFRYSTFRLETLQSLRPIVTLSCRRVRQESCPTPFGQR